MACKPNRFRFRAWDAKSGRMMSRDELEPQLIAHTATPVGCVELFVDHPLDREMPILMQSTGLADSKGVEIFEGDVCEHGVVVWKDGAMGLDTGSATYVPGGLRADRTRHWTIIGNIHGNPELVQ